VQKGRALVSPGNPHLRRDRQGQLHPRDREIRGPASFARKHLHQGLAGVEEPVSARRFFIAAVLLSFVVGASAARADDRPSEDSLLGGGSSSAPTTAPAFKTHPGPSPSSTEKFGHGDAEELKSDERRDAFASGEVTDNPLQIGGLYYQRWIASKPDG